jgi:hypothetical protein
MGIESVRFLGYYWRQNDEQWFDPEFPNRNALQKTASIGKSRLGAISSVMNQLGLG